MSDWMFDDGSAEALLGQDYVSAPPLVWDEADPQSAPSEERLYGDEPAGEEVDPITVWGSTPSDTIFNGGGGRWQTDTAWLDQDQPDVMPCTPPPDGPTPEGWIWMTFVIVRRTWRPPSTG